MPEPSTCEHHEQIANLQAQLAALKQENLELRSRLQLCEQAEANESLSDRSLRYSDITDLRETQQALQAEQARTRSAAEHSAELAKANEELQQRDRLLSVVAQITKDLLEADNVDIAIPAALQAVGEAATMSRVLLILERQDSMTQQLKHCVEFEWVAPGIYAHAAVGMAVMDNENFQVLTQPLYAGQSIWRVMEELPEVTRAQFEKLEIQSTGVVPIFIEGRYIGCVGFDDCVTPRRWSQQEIDVLTTAAESIGAALHRKQLVDRMIAERLHAEQARSQELEKINNALKRSLDALASESSLERFLGQVLTAIAEQLQALQAEYWYHPTADLIYIGMMSRQGNVYSRDEIAQLHPNHPGIVGVPTPADMAVEPLEQRRQYCIRDNFENEWYREHAEQFALGLYQELNLPMVSGETNIGALVIRVPRDHQFTTQQVELAQALTHQATLAAQLTRLAEAAKQAAIAGEQEKAAQERAAELAKANDALQATIDAMANIDDLDEFIPAVLKIVAQTFQVGQTENCAYFEHDTDDRVYLRYWLFENHVFRPEELLALDSDRFATVRRLAAGFTVPDAYLGTPVRERTKAVILDHLAGTLEPDFDEFACANSWHMELNVPLVVDGYADGALVAYRSAGEQFTRAEVTLAESLGKQLALAMQANRLATESKSKAVETAIAREQERAAQQQAAELAKANESLRRSLKKLANERNLDAYLEHILREALQMLEGTIAQIFLYDSTTDTLSASIGVDQQGEFLPTPGLVSELSIAAPFPANITGIWQRLLKHRGAIQLDLDRDADDFWPGMIEWHRSRGNQAILCVPMLMGDVPLGLLGLASTKRIEFTVSELEFTQALVQQATLAIQLTRLAEEAKQAAIAREQEKAAQDRAAELAKANAVLRGATDRLAKEPSLEAFLGHVLAEACQEAIEAGAIFLYEENQAHLVPVVMQGVTANYPYSERQPVPITAFSTWLTLLHTRQPLVIDIDKQPEVFAEDTLAWHRAQGHRGIVLAPLMIGDRPLGMFGIAACNKVTFKETELELFQALAQQATLAIQLTRLAEEAKQAAILDERNRMARDIHDTLAQAFGGILMQLQAADRFFISKPSNAHNHLMIAHQLAQDGLDEARRTVWLLYQDDLEYRDLSTLIPEVVTHMLTNVDVKVQVEISGTPYDLEPDIGMNLLRITQESINNALRHANAHTLRVHLTYTPQHLRLCVRDDGCGFDPNQLYQGFGLTGMQQRARTIGAQFHLNSHPDTGTEVCIILPSPAP